MGYKLGKIKDSLNDKPYTNKKLSDCIECGYEFENTLDQKVCSHCQELLDGFLGELNKT